VFSSFCMLMTWSSVGASRALANTVMVDGINDRRKFDTCLAGRASSWRTRRRVIPPRTTESRHHYGWPCGRVVAPARARRHRHHVDLRRRDTRWLHPVARARTGRRRTRAPSTFLLRTACTLELIELDHGPYDTRDEQIDADGPVRRSSPGTHAQCFGGAFVASTVSFTKGCFTDKSWWGASTRAARVFPGNVRASGPSEARSTRCSRRRVRPHCGTHDSTRRGESVVGLGFAHRSLLATRNSPRHGRVVEEIA